MGQLISHMLYGTNNWKLQLSTKWTDIVGPLASRMSIEKIEQDTLIIAVSDAVWLQELYLLSEVLLQKINHSLPAPYIKHIKFKQAQAPACVRKKKTRNFSTQLQQQLPLTQEEQGALQAIGDQELGAVLYKFLLRCRQTTEN